MRFGILVMSIDMQISVKIVFDDSGRGGGAV